MRYTMQGEHLTDVASWFADGLERHFERNGYQWVEPGGEDFRIVFNFIRPDDPRPYRRKAQATYVVSIAHVEDTPDDVLRAAYPLLVRTLSNLFIYLVGTKEDTTAYFVTLEQGYYPVPCRRGEDESFFAEAFRRLEPLATSTLIINNEFSPDLPEELWEGDPITEQLSRAARKVAEMNLWPAPFPIQELLPPEGFRHVKRLYGIGGLSYGNLSTRKDRDCFWRERREQGQTGADRKRYPPCQVL